MIDEESKTTRDAWNLSRFDWADPYDTRYRQFIGWNS
jgi:hypothetical protein